MPPSYCSIHFIIFILIALSSTVISGLVLPSAIVTPTASQPTSNSYLCSQPLNPSYSSLQRYAHYTLLAFIAINPLKTPLFHGALAAVMTRTAIAALYAIALAARETTNARLLEQFNVEGLQTAGPGVLNLDFVGAWTILSTTVALVPIMLTWSRALVDVKSVTAAGGRSKARVLVRVWAVLVVAGMVTAWYAIWRANKVLKQGESIYSSPVLESGRRCSTAQVFSRGDEGVLVDVDRVLGQRWDTLVKVAYASLAAAALALWGAAGDGLIRIGKAILDPNPGDDFVERGLSSEPRMSLPSAAGPRRLFVMLYRLAVWAMPVFCIVAIVYAERYIGQKPELPSIEGMTSVGQWGIWAGMGLVLLAAAIGEGVKRASERSIAGNDSGEESGAAQ